MFSSFVFLPAAVGNKSINNDDANDNNDDDATSVFYSQLNQLEDH